MRAQRRLVTWWSGRPAALRWSLPVAEMALLWWSSSRSFGGPSAGTLRVMLSNAAHVVAYGAMAALLHCASAGNGPLRRRHALLPIAIAVGFGVVDEIHQSFVPGRVSSVADLVSDLAGACLAIALLWELRTGDRRWRRMAFGAAATATASVLVATFTTW